MGCCSSESDASRRSSRNVPVVENRKCGLCKETNKAEKYLEPLECTHYFHHHCLYKELNKISEGRFDDSLKNLRCNVCDVIIPIEDLNRIFHEETLARWRSNPSFICTICRFEFKIESEFTRTLDCDHRFCFHCLQRYLTHKVELSHLAERNMVCPADNCDAALTTHQIEDLLNKEDWDTFNKFRLKKEFAKTNENEDSNEKFVFCSKCDTPFCLPKTAKSFTCRNRSCKTKNCLRHKEPVSHKRWFRACKKYEEKIKNNSDADKKFKRMARKKKMKQCPSCGIWIEKIEGGCNYIKCNSPECQENTKLCYLCGKEFSTMNHFYREGPFGKRCNTMDDIQDLEDVTMYEDHPSQLQ
jgi:hypothetical protein